jgi:hypothetical protein
MSALLEKDRQAQWAERAEQGAPRRQYETRWVIEKMRPYIEPQHYTLAYTIRDLTARSRGLRVGVTERVDMGNAAEIAALSRLDAGRKIAGYRGAVTARVAGGAKCFDCIADEYTLAQTITACGYAAGSHRSVRQLVQLTMMAAQDYADACEAEIKRWRAM